eukprot:766877-Hanusia_phi.AAC.1
MELWGMIFLVVALYVFAPFPSLSSLSLASTFASSSSRQLSRPRPSAVAESEEKVRGGVSKNAEEVVELFASGGQDCRWDSWTGPDASHDMQVAGKASAQIWSHVMADGLVSSCGTGNVGQLGDLLEIETSGGEEERGEAAMMRAEPQVIPGRD